MVQPPVSSEGQHDDRDADPCPPEDEECFDAPDAAIMEEAISKFVLIEAISKFVLSFPQP